MGHFYLGDKETGNQLLGVFSCSYAATVGGSHEVAQLGYASLINTLLYSMYAGYRDARAFNKAYFYSYQMPTDSFKDLAYASFNPQVLKKPEVWGGLLGSLALATALGYCYKKTSIGLHTATSLTPTPIAAFAVGIGEEAFFRGSLQTQLIEVSNPSLGIALSSLLFGAAHLPNANALEKEDRWRYYSLSLPFITAFGAYFGWMTHKNNSLKESVALHSWYDFVLFAAAASADSAAIGKPSFALSLPF